MSATDVDVRSQRLVHETVPTAAAMRIYGDRCKLQIGSVSDMMPYMDLICHGIFEKPSTSAYRSAFRPSPQCSVSHSSVGSVRRYCAAKKAHPSPMPCEMGTHTHKCKTYTCNFGKYNRFGAQNMRGQIMCLYLLGLCRTQLPRGQYNATQIALSVFEHMLPECGDKIRYSRKR